MQRVLVLDQQQRPLMPCRPARALWLLRKQRAAVFRYAPFTIILREARPEAVVTPLRLKIDPGSVTTGLAVLNERSSEVVWATGSCDVTTNYRWVGSISIRYCRPLQRLDGYRYAQVTRALPPPTEVWGASAPWTSETMPRILM